MGGTREKKGGKDDRKYEAQMFGSIVKFKQIKNGNRKKRGGWV